MRYSHFVAPAVVSRDCAQALARRTKTRESFAAQSLCLTSAPTLLVRCDDRVVCCQSSAERKSIAWVCDYSSEPGASSG